MASDRLIQLGHYRRAFTLVELLVVIAIIGILVALLLPAIQAAREAARRTQCANNIKNLAIAVLTYEDTKKSLPKGVTAPDGQTWDGTKAPFTVNAPTTVGPNWVIQILPQMEEVALYDSMELTKGINDSSAPLAANRNYIARGTVIPSFLCPSDLYNNTTYSGHGGNWARGNYAASAGVSFLMPTSMHGPLSGPWSGSTQAQRDLGQDYTCRRGVIGPNAAVTLGQIGDGTSKTIMLGEIRAGLKESDSRGVWALGLAGSSLLAMYGFNGDANGPNAGFSNGDDIFADSEVCGTASGACVTPSGLAANEGMSCTSPGAAHQATVRSKHPGGVHVALCDASVQFITDNIETSGCYGSCCSAWDSMILSNDGGRGGSFNGVTSGGRGSTARPCQ